MSDLAEQVGIGGAVAVLLVATVMKFLPAFMAALKSQNGKNGHKSGDLSTSEWEGKMRDIARNANEEMMADMRTLMDARNEKLREIIRQELKSR
jgi:hypothetical protein